MAKNHNSDLLALSCIYFLLIIFSLALFPFVGLDKTLLKYMPTILFVVTGISNFLVLNWRNAQKTKELLQVYSIFNVLPILFFGGIGLLSPNTLGFTVIYLSASIFGTLMAWFYQRYSPKVVLPIAIAGLLLFASKSHFVIMYIMKPSIDISEQEAKALDGMPDFTHAVPVANTANPTNIISNKISVVELWATWCRPCIALLPSYNKLYKKYKVNDNIQFMAISVGGSNSETSEKVRLFTEKRNHEFPTYLDSNGIILKSLGQKSIPFTFITHNDTVVAAFLSASGPDAYFDEVSHTVDSLLTINQ